MRVSGSTYGKLYEIDGESRTICAWAVRYGVPAHRVYSRVGLGWTLKDALTKSVRERGQFRVPRDKKIAGGLASLSPRELEIATHFTLGKTFKTVSRQLDIAISTVANHCCRIYKKCGVQRKDQLVALIVAGRVHVPTEVLRRWRVIAGLADAALVAGAPSMCADLDGLLPLERKAEIQPGMPTGRVPLNTSTMLLGEAA